MDKTTVIIPCYGDPKLNTRCVFSVLNHSRADILLIDNGVSNLSMFLNYKNVRIFRPNENIGYPKAINAGIALSTSPYLVFLNCDTEVEPFWLDRMQDSFTAVTAAVGPLTDNASQPQGRYEAAKEAIRVFPEKIEMGWGIAMPMSFFCVMVSREAINDIGYLDDGFSPGYGEDDDWLYRAHLRGWELRINKSVQVKHTPHSTWDEQDRMNAQRNAVERLIFKYGKKMAPAALENTT